MRTPQRSLILAIFVFFVSIIIVRLLGSKGVVSTPGTDSNMRQMVRVFSDTESSKTDPVFASVPRKSALEPIVVTSIESYRYKMVTNITSPDTDKPCRAVNGIFVVEETAVPPLGWKALISATIQRKYEVISFDHDKAVVFDGRTEYTLPAGIDVSFYISSIAEAPWGESFHFEGSDSYLQYKGESQGKACFYIAYKGISLFAP